ncbi:FAD-binding oxidoreductase [Paenibacillus radicis (ex Xue et al. 2023)]|uniref:FAD-binding oxidoreductase n=1 Tax=Paenibacillus radicis (ex Xue et al. 2023) TaxID=2972489 RepID=A0ABT1YJJ5_9BACL|nr:FAD-binding oxidoreductase [Paenibacillus radicis (ex Xue et al. 2023)]MCR8633331.1 FAD-binding oxidoreductase [Paenibacillus radicis (ex Xue et al. 2023)]
MATDLEWEKEMMKLLGEEVVVFDMATREKLSKDYYWYSPVLDNRLKDNKPADGVALPRNEEEVAAVLAFGYRYQIPVTVRGAGTGNYGQAVPLQGGIVLDLSRMDRILEIGEGFARLQCGVRLGVMDKTAREAGQEIRIYPSTYVKATVGGFVSGGSGGIGSITYGNLWDGNVLEAVVYTMEETPKRLVVAGKELYDYIHNYGTTGIMTEVTIPLAPRTEWVQVIAQFPSFEQSMRFSEALAKDGAIHKRLISPMEWPVPSYFTPLSKVIESDMAAVMLEIADGLLPEVEVLAQSYGGHIGHVIESEKYRKTIGVSDFTWNHTTLWAMKTDATLTYLQAGFNLGSYMEQMDLIKKQFGDEVLFHFEWIRSGGNVTPTCLPLVFYKSEERLYEIIGYFESIGVKIFDPHTWVLDNGGRGEVGSMERRKRQNDPQGLLNPGKINYVM